MDSYSHLALSSCHFLRNCPRSSEITIWSIPRRFGGSGIHIVPEPMLLGLKCVLGITSTAGEKSQSGRSRDALTVGPVGLFLCFLFSYQILVILSHSSDLDIWPCFQFFEWTLAPYSVLLRIYFFPLKLKPDALIGFCYPLSLRVRPYWPPNFRTLSRVLFIRDRYR